MGEKKKVFTGFLERKEPLAAKKKKKKKFEMGGSVKICVTMKNKMTLLTSHGWERGESKLNKFIYLFYFFLP